MPHFAPNWHDYKESDDQNIYKLSVTLIDYTDRDVSILLANCWNNRMVKAKSKMLA